jgi:histidinol-phosphatase (PHP family)
MLFDHHVHLEHGPYTPHDYPDTWLEQFVAVARSRGVAGLGIVEHGYRFREAWGLLPVPWADARCRFDLAPYVAWVNAHRRDDLAWGIEMDYVPGKEAAIREYLRRGPWDFVLGSVHWLGSWGIDVAEMQQEYERRDPEALWAEYYDTMIRMVASGLFDVATHPDLPKIFGHPRPAPEVRRRLYARFTEVLADTGVALEINVAGLRRPVGEIYPEPALLEEAYRRGIAVTLASDAHEPENAGRDLAQAAALARSIGWTSARGFRAGERVDVPFDAAGP